MSQEKHDIIIVLTGWHFFPMWLSYYVQFVQSWLTTTDQLGGLEFKTAALDVSVHFPGGEPKMFQRSSSAKSQLDVVWMRR